MCTRCAFLGGLAAFAVAPASASARTGDPQALEVALPTMRRFSATLWLGELTPNVWIHTTTRVLDGIGYYPANGAIVIDGNASLLIDTGWNDASANAILGAWEQLRKPAVSRALVTHFHVDRLGGIGALSERGIPVFGNPRTIALARAIGLPAPRPLEAVEQRPQRLGTVEIFYPGAGHTIDNVVACIPRDDVLFGGCLVKSTTADDLGNISDANVRAWPATMATLARRFAPRHVIPGHGTVAGNALAHTRALADTANRTPAQR